MRFARKFDRGPTRRRKATCCDSVAMHAVSRPCELKSLRNERWRRPLSRREIGERAVPTRKEVTTPAGNGAPLCTCKVLFVLWFKSDTRNPSARRQNGRVRALSGPSRSALRTDAKPDKSGIGWSSGLRRKGSDRLKQPSPSLDDTWHAHHSIVIFDQFVKSFRCGVYLI